METNELSIEIISRIWNKDIPIGSRGNIFINCPNHKDKTPSMSVNLDKGIFNCFSCGESGSLKNIYYNEFGETIERTLNINKERKDYSFNKLPLFNKKSYLSNDISIFKLEPIETKFIVEGDLLDVTSDLKCLQYLKDRCIDVKVARDMNFKFSKNLTTYSIDDKDHKIYFWNRLIIPVYENGKLISIEGRSLEKDATKKVLYPKGSSTNTLYQLNKLDKNKTLYIVEGIMDLAVLRSEKFFRNSTSIFGSNITKRQAFLLKDFKDICYIYDNDNAGHLSVRKLKTLLNKDFNILAPPRGAKDVGDMPIKLGLPINEALKKNWLNNITSSKYL